MLRTQIYLPEELHYQLAQLARLEDTSISQIIRTNLTKSLGKKPQIKVKDFFETLIKMGKKHKKYTVNLPKNFSSKHTEYYLETVAGK